MSDERYDRSADMRLLELRRAALGMPPRVSGTTLYTDSDALTDLSKDDDEAYVQSGTILVAAIDARPRTALIPGALVTVSLSVANDGDIAARDVRMALPLPADTVYRPGTLIIDGSAGSDVLANALFASGADLGEIGPGARCSLIIKLQVEAGFNDIILIPHLSAKSGAVLGLRAMRLLRQSSSSPSFVAERPFYESDETEHAHEPLAPARPEPAIGVLQPRELPPPPATPKLQPVAQTVPTATSIVTPVAQSGGVPLVPTVAEPVTAIVTERVAKTIPEPAGNPVTQPVAKVVSAQVAKIIREAAAKLVAGPVAKIATEPAAKIVPEPVAKTATEPVAKTVPEPVAKIVPQPVAKIVPEPVAKIVPEPVAKIVPQPVAKIVAERVAKSVPQPVAKPEAARIATIVAAPVRKSVTPVVVTSVTEPVAKNAKEPIAKSLAERVAKIFAEPAASSVTEPTVKSTTQTVAKTVRGQVAKTVAEPTAKILTAPARKPANIATTRLTEPKAKAKVRAKVPQTGAPPTANTLAESSARPKIEVVRSVDDRISFVGQGGPILAVQIDRKRLTTITGLFNGPSLGMIAHYLVLNALAVRDPLPGDGTDDSISAFVSHQEQLLSRALITTRLGKTPSPDSVGAALPAFPPALAMHTEQRAIGQPPRGQAMLFRAFQPTEVLFVGRMLSNDKAAPFMRAAQLFVGLCANDAVVADERQRSRVGVALTAYAALATAEISRIFLRAKLSGAPALFKQTDSAFDDAARTVLAAIASSIV